MALAVNSLIELISCQSNLAGYKGLYGFKHGGHDMPDGTLAPDIMRPAIDRRKHDLRVAAIAAMLRELADSSRMGRYPPDDQDHF